MDKVKTYLTSSAFSRTEVEPVFKGDFEWVKDESFVYYRLDIKDKIKFSRKEDFDLVMLMEDDECGEITIEVEQYCSDGYSEYWRGIFSIFDCTINKTRCWLEVKPTSDDPYRCFDEASKEEVSTFFSQVVSTSGLYGEIEEVTCISVASNANCNDYQAMLQLPGSACLLNPTQWCLKENIVQLNGNVNPTTPCSGTNNSLRQDSTWYREVLLDVPCIAGSPSTPTFGSGWQLLEDNCSSDGTCSWWRCPDSGAENREYLTGRKLDVFLSKIMTEMGCGLTVKSDFFNINAQGDAPQNIAYDYAQLYLRNITVHQKSDIKRKNSLSPSSDPAWRFKPTDWFSDLEKIFNVRYAIEGNQFIIEHYSFFTSDLGPDMTDTPMFLQFDYSGNENIKTEKFFWMDELVSFTFRANDIVYSCGKEETEQRCTLVTTDIPFIEDEENDEKVSDEGFVIISNDLVSGDLIIIDSNDPMRWVKLHENLHKHGRLYRSGKINNSQQDFLSWIPYKKQESFKVDHCCGDAFNPNDLIRTKLGDGSVESASHNIFTGRLEIQLIY